MPPFQDEPDEAPSPTIFQNEADEEINFMFQDEPDEDVQPVHPAREPASHAEQPQLFGDELSEQTENDGGSNSESNSSAYLADGEADCDPGQQDLVRQVQLNFSTLTTFLSTQLNFKTESVSEPAKKKRRYNNANRAAKAAAASTQKEREQPRARRIARNDPDALL